MQNKILTIIIIVLAALTLFNIGALCYIEVAEARPHSAYTVEVLGAVFKEESEPNAIDIHLVRPPRVAVMPGEESVTGSAITNTAPFETFIRATYRVDIKDKAGNLVKDFNSKVVVNINEGWFYHDGYWYYDSAIKPEEKIPGPIKSIVYSEDFSEHMDYKVYIPVLVESVETADNTIFDINYWPDKNIQKINIEDYMSGEISWTTKVVIE